MTWSANVELNLNAGSRLVFDDGKLDQVYLGAVDKVTIDGKSYAVGIDENNASYRLNAKNELTAFISGEGNTIDIEGQAVAIENGSRVNTTAESGKCIIEKIFVGNEVTVKVYKGSKVKEVTVKAGKKIAFEAGKVVKAG